MDRQASLCWGQRYVWLNHHHLPPADRQELNLTISLEPPDGSTVESIRLALDLLVRRHEGLRSTLHASGEGGPWQQVHPVRSLPVTFVDTGEHPPAEVTRLVNDFTEVPFDIETEWPLRACLVTAGPVPRRLVLVCHHTAMDDWSLEALKREAHELHESILAGRRASLPPVRHHPVDLARYEAGEQAERAHQQGLAHWRRVLAQVPGDLFGARRTRVEGGSTPSAARASISSPPAHAAARELAARHGVWPSIVHTAAFGALLCGYTGAPSVWYAMYAGNRGSAPYGEVLGCQFQPVPVLVDCSDDPSLAELVRRTAKQCGEALENSRGRYDEFVEEVSRYATERGTGIRIPAAVNHLRYPDKARGGTRTIVNQNPPPERWSLLDDDLYLRVSEWSDCLVGTLTARSTVMSGRDVERFLRGLETLLTTQATGPRELAVSEVARLVGFAPAPVRWAAADPDRIAERLTEHPGVRAARVFAAPDGELTAYLVGADPPPDPGLLRAHLLARVYDTPGLACPHRFVICDREPADAGRAGSWAELPVLASGEGRKTPAVPPATPAERALDEAVRIVTGVDGFGMAHGYVAAGGRVRDIPAVRRYLRDRGWVGASLYEVASARPLAEIAARLVRIGTEPAGTEPAGTEPAGTEPAGTEPAGGSGEGSHG